MLKFNNQSINFFFFKKKKYFILFLNFKYIFTFKDENLHEVKVLEHIIYAKLLKFFFEKRDLFSNPPALIVCM
jgi:hypothetical protein